MRRLAQQAIRPLVFLSFLLLGLSVVAPWMWTRLARAPFRLVRAPETKSPSEKNSAGTNTVPPLPEHVTADDPKIVSVLIRHPAPGAETQPIATELAHSPPPFDWEPQPRDLGARAPVALENILAPAQPAPLKPPVTELIALDPSLADSGVAAEVTPANPMSRYIEPSLDEPMTPEQLQTPLPKEPPRQPAPLPPPSVGVWPFPSRLVQQLHDLASEFPANKAWSDDVIAQLDRLSTLDSFVDPQADQAFEVLHRLAEAVRDQSGEQTASRERTLKLRAGYSLVRRLAIWEEVAAITRSNPPDIAAIIPREQLAAALAQVQQQIAHLQSYPEWSRYLKLSEVSLLLQSDAEAPTTQQRILARQVLGRLDSPRLNQQQYDFISTAAFQEYMSSLIPVAQETISFRSVLEQIERHESIDQSEIGNQLAAEISTMRWSQNDDIRCFARLLNDNYRNANVRLAISDQLINRFLPPQPPMEEDVVDEIRGAQVLGRSEATSRLRIVLLPDRLRWRMGLEARGAVSSETQSSKGPARFWNDGLGEFHARKVVTVDRRGLRSEQAEASATSQNYLKDFETNYDSIPLVGSIARSIARQQYDREQPLARHEIEHKISQKASDRLDTEVERRLVDAEKNFQDKFLAPLERLNLEPTPVQMETTPNRLICRYRMAGSHQLGSHTPRPQAPGDSMLSLQLHQSLFNNVLENLKLADRKVELRQLYVEMLERFKAQKIEVPEDLPENVTVHFAKSDAVRITCEDGRLRLAIRIQELNYNDERVWRNFEVHGFYVPSDNQQEANLVREGRSLLLVGEGLNLGDQVTLRGIFAKVLSKNRTLSLVNKQLLSRPELADLQVSQFAIQDGWIGIAMGPGNARSTQNPKTESTPETARHPVREFIQRLR